MEKIDPMTLEYFALIGRILNVIACWPLESSKKRLRYTKYIIISLTVLLTLLAEINQFFVDMSENFSSSVESMCLIVTAITSMLKLIQYQINKNYLIKIMKGLSRLYKNTPVDYEKANNFKSIFKQSNRITTIMFTGCSICVFIYSTTTWINYFSTGTLVFPYNSRFPFDTSSMKIFLPFYLLEVGASFTVAFLFGGDTFFSSSILFVCNRIEVLIESFRVCIKETEDLQRKQLFVKCVLYHNKILR